ncbi:hypothetical protein [Streptomyces yanii]|uniref:Uncharacterized protein n=1 Tax=Streptomyces yanii TaxID=78510 RepID=A0ABV5R7U3_9ACTN
MLVLVDHSAETVVSVYVEASNLPGVGDGFGECAQRHGCLQGAVGAVLVVELLVEAAVELQNYQFNAHGVELGVDIAGRLIGYRQAFDDVYGTWSAPREVSDRGCVLVGPDRYVTRRSADLVSDPVGALREVMRQVLACPRRPRRPSESRVCRRVRPRSADSGQVAHVPENPARF